MPQRIRNYSRSTSDKVAIFKGLGMIRKNTFGRGLKEARRNSEQRPLTDEEIQSALSAGFRVYDKQRGIYVHI